MAVEGVAGVQGEGGKEVKEREDVEENVKCLEDVEGDEGVGIVGCGEGEGGFIFLRYLSFLFLLLLRVEGLGFFLAPGVAGASFFWLSKKKDKEVPRVREKVKVLFWLASAWQKSRHLVAMLKSFTSVSDIWELFLN